MAVIVRIFRVQTKEAKCCGGNVFVHLWTVFNHSV